MDLGPSLNRETVTVLIRHQLNVNYMARKLSHKAVVALQLIITLISSHWLQLIVVLRTIGEQYPEQIKVLGLQID